MFIVAHYKLKTLFNIYQVKESLNMSGLPLEHSKELELEALNALTELGNRMSDFSDKCYNTYTVKYNSFEQEILDK